MTTPTPPERYELLDEIASGGMGTVYLARLRGGGGFVRDVAIKRAHPRLIARDPSFARTLLDEAKIAAHVRHPNVVSVLDVEARDDELYLVMDYVDGVSLDVLLATDGAADALTAGARVRILLDAAAGLAAVHAATDRDRRPLGIVHRDVSPHNVLVGRDGIARISDFGVARADADAVSAGAPERPTGKSSYVAPECLEGLRPDARSDLFSLAVVGWELLTGERLFRDETEAATLNNVRSRAIDAPSRRAAWVPAGLDGVILAALVRDPPSRTRDVATFRRELEREAAHVGLVGSHDDVSGAVARLVDEGRRNEGRAADAVASDPLGRTEPTRTLGTLPSAPALHDVRTASAAFVPYAAAPIASASPSRDGAARRRNAWFLAATITAAGVTAIVAQSSSVATKRHEPERAGTRAASASLSLAAPTPLSSDAPAPAPESPATALSLAVPEADPKPASGRGARSTRRAPPALAATPRPRPRENDAPPPNPYH